MVFRTGKLPVRFFCFNKLKLNIMGLFSNMKANRQRRKAYRRQRKAARIAVKSAKKLQKIYGDMDPDTVDQLNSISPVVPQMADQLQQDGVNVPDPSDPVAVSAAYNQQYGEGTPGLDENDVQDLNAEYDPDSENYESYEHADEARAKARSKVDPNAVLNTLFSGVESGLLPSWKDFSSEDYDEKKPVDEHKKIFEEIMIGLFVALLAYIIFK